MRLQKLTVCVGVLALAGLVRADGAAPRTEACASDGTVAVAVSPDGRNRIRLWRSPLAYDVARDGVTVVAKTEIGMTVDGHLLTETAAPEVTTENRTGTCATPLYKKASVDLAANEVRTDFGQWAVRLAARNDGVAYRFETEFPGQITVQDERAGLTIPDETASCAFYYGKRPGCEETVPQACEARNIRTDGPDRAHVYLPLSYSIGGRHVVVLESDVHDYPVWNLTRADATAGVAFASCFAAWPKDTYHAAENADWSKPVEMKEGGRWVKVRSDEPWLVKTEGARTFPWRAFVLADAPAQFCESDLVFALARPQAKPDFSWVKPGKVAWDWWNAWDNQGEARGCTTATYRRFIDFASLHGIEYVILDEGWSEKLNIWKFHPNVDVPALIRYGSEKGVGIILWMAWAQIYGHEEEVARRFAALGAKGFKVDFMDRGDADCERFLWRFAAACAENRMLVDYHGAHRPTGMSRAYPNVLNYEGVHGLECAKWFRNEYDFPDNDIKQFFLRMTAGPMDYTPGAMDNYPLGQYTGTGVNPGSVGTRCHQLAMLVAYEAPLQMLCDAPSKYEQNDDCLKFLAKVPVVWTQTKGLGGSPDSFAAVAREARDGSWYVAVLNNAVARTVSLKLSFLDRGTWRAEAFRDADDAQFRPSNYVHERALSMTAGDEMSVRLAPGGGCVLHLVRDGGRPGF